MNMRDVRFTIVKHLLGCHCGKDAACAGHETFLDVYELKREQPELFDAYCNMRIDELRGVSPENIERAALAEAHADSAGSFVLAGKPMRKFVDAPYVSLVSKVESGSNQGVYDSLYMLTTLLRDFAHMATRAHRIAHVRLRACAFVNEIDVSDISGLDDV